MAKRYLDTIQCSCWDRIRYNDIYDLYRTGKVLDDHNILLNNLVSKYNMEARLSDIKLIVEWEMGSCSDLEERCICAIASGINARKVLEIGTYRGRTTVNLAGNLEEKSRVYTLDLPQKNVDFTMGQHIKEHQEIAHKIVQLYGDSRSFDFSPYYGQIDFVLIDGAHDYRTVKSDSDIGLQCLRKGGFIVWHDFSPRCLGNSKAIIETCRKHGLDLNWISDTSLAIARRHLPARINRASPRSSGFVTSVSL